MGKTKIVLNRAGVRELMQSPEMQAILVEHSDGQTHYEYIVEKGK